MSKRFRVTHGCRTGLRIFSTLVVLALALPVNASEPGEIARLQQLSQSIYDNLERMQRGLADVPDFDTLDQELSLAVARARSLGSPETVISLLRSRAALSIYRNDHTYGAAYLEEAVYTHEQYLPESASKSYLYRNLAYSYALLGRLAEAKALLRYCLFENKGDSNTKEYSRDLYSLADVHLKSGELETAARYLRMVRDFNIGTDEYMYHVAILKLGSIARKSGEYSQAISLHREAYDYFSASIRYREIVAEIELAKDHFAQGNFEIAVDFALAALSDERSLTEQKIDASLVLYASAVYDGSAALELGGVDQVYKNLLALIESSRQTMQSDWANPIRQIEFYSLCISSALLQKNKFEAQSCSVNAMSVISHVRNELSRSADNEMAFLASIQDYIAPFIDLYLSDNDAAGLFEFLEFLTPAHVIRKLGEGTDDEFHRYLAAEHNILRAATKSSNELTKAEMDDLRSKRDILLESLDPAAVRPPVGLDALGKNERIGSAGHLGFIAEQLVPQGEIVLRYYNTDMHSILAARTSGGSEIFELPPRSTLEPLIQVVKTHLHKANPLNHEVIASLKTLAHTLVPDDLALEGQRVILVADDLIHGLPFSLLVGQSLVGSPTESASVEVIRANSAASYYAPSSVAATSYSNDSLTVQNPSIVVFADPDFGGVGGQLDDAYRNWVEDLPRLVYSSTEAEYIKQLYPQSNVELYLGALATTENLVSSTARQADILHIATHGYYNPETPSVVGLATAGRGEGAGFLSLSRLFDVNYHVNLVVISACETMLGRQYEGVGVSGLADGLIASGAGAVVGTLWQVSDKATALFMRSFYQNLSAMNGDAAKALAATKDQFKVSARYSSPHFWAGMVLQSSHRSYSHDVFTRRTANGI